MDEKIEHFAVSAHEAMKGHRLPLGGALKKYLLNPPMVVKIFHRPGGGSGATWVRPRPGLGLEFKGADAERFKL